MKIIYLMVLSILNTVFMVTSYHDGYYVISLINAFAIGVCITSVISIVNREKES